jgi:type IV pilus assembly protein PilC
VKCAPRRGLRPPTLRRQGINVSQGQAAQGLFARQKITEKDITLFTRQLATMMKAGVPLLQAFDIVGKRSHCQCRPASCCWMTSSRTWRPASSMSTPSASTPSISTRSTATWSSRRAGGILDTVLDRLATYKEKMLAIKGKIKSALFYPPSS